MNERAWPSPTDPGSAGAESGDLTSTEWSFWDNWMRAQRILVREIDSALQRDFGISKPEFSVLVTLQATPMSELRVTELADALDWDKSRVAHLLTRMESRDLVERREAGAAGRRTGIALTKSGRDVVDRAVLAHGRTVRRLSLDRMTAAQVGAIAEWSAQLIADAERGAAAGMTDSQPS